MATNEPSDSAMNSTPLREICKSCEKKTTHLCINNNYMSGLLKNNVIVTKAISICIDRLP